MISITFQGTLEEIHREMRSFLLELEPVKKEPESIKVAEKVVSKASTSEQTTSKAASQAEAPQAEPPVDLLTEIKAVIPKLVKVKGRPAIVELLAEFGAKSGGDIKEADRATFLTKARSLLA